MIKNRRAFITGIKSLKLNSSEIKFLKRYKPWGVILFSRNIKDISQTKKLTDHIRKIFRDKNYPILIDQEGGRVNRLNNIISFNTLTSEYFGDFHKFVERSSYQLFFLTTFEKKLFYQFFDDFPSSNGLMV